MTTALPACDRAIAEAAKDDAAPAHPRLIVLITVLASSLAFIDGSVVNVGLPALAAAFPSRDISLSWIVTGYLLPLSALLMLGGAAGDRFGQRRLLLGGVGLFLLASLVCALAPAFGWLLAGRMLQGVGAALLMPTSLAILGNSFRGEARGKAIGTWAAAGAAAGALGPLVGGWLIDLLGWRAIFFINLPIAAAAMLLGARYLHHHTEQAGAPLDVGGAVLATGALGALTWGLTVGSAEQGWTAPAWSGVVAGLVLLVAFLGLERRRGQSAMLPLQLFTSRQFVGLSLLTFLLYGALGALLVLLPYVLIERQHLSATQAGAALLPLPLVLALLAPVMGRFAARHGSRWPLTFGPLVVAVGFLLAMHIPGGTGYWGTVLPAMLVVSLGMAGAVAPLTTAVLGAVTPEHAGIASGLNSALARTGGLVATALASSVLAAHGDALARNFAWAMGMGAASAVAAGACAWCWLGGRAGP